MISATGTDEKVPREPTVLTVPILAIFHAAFMAVDCMVLKIEKLDKGKGEDEEKVFSVSLEIDQTVDVH